MEKEISNLNLDALTLDQLQEFNGGGWISYWLGYILSAIDK
jgi:hypothetical protein